jgi:hypothetical protein
MDQVADMLGIPIWALVGFLALTVGVQLIALVDLARRDRVLWDRKWIWALIILFVNSGLGAILWFALGRRVPQEDAADGPAAQAASVGKRAESAVDLLYGERGAKEDTDT